MRVGVQIQILALLMLAGCAASPATPAAPASAPGCDLSAECRELAAEFVRLRALEGHFQGGPWIAEVDEWMGRKHQVMLQLSDRLAGAGCDQNQVTDLLGSPDMTVLPGDPLFEQIGRQMEAEMPVVDAPALLIYHWRGAHDFLYFTSDGQTILSSGWCYAYE